MAFFIISVGYFYGPFGDHSLSLHAKQQFQLLNKKENHFGLERHEGQ